MKKSLLILFVFSLGGTLTAQVVTTNRNTVGMEHNLLFNANDRYTVAQTGSATLILDRLFDGKFLPSYTSTAPSLSNPTIITIEGLPNNHIQAQAIIGWSTRYWPPSRFKIEGYETYYGDDNWETLADYSSQDYSGYSFWLNVKLVKPGSYRKLRFTFYEGTGTNGRLGISELFFLHPEATTPYKGLLVSTDDSWKTSGNDLYYNSGNVGIGVSSPEHELEVDGTIRAMEVIVETDWADHVFSDDYELMDLEYIQQYIQKNGHLPGVPNSQEIESSGLSLGMINKVQMEKIEELTLYLIEQNKRLIELEKLNRTLSDQLKMLIMKYEYLETDNQNQ